MAKTYIGLADDHGIQLLIQEHLVDIDLLLNDQMLNMWMLKGRRSGHRNAVVFRVEVSNMNGRRIENMLKRNRYCEALVFMKKNAKRLGLIGHNGERFWSLIPDPRRLTEENTTGKAKGDGTRFEPGRV